MIRAYLATKLLCLVLQRCVLFKVQALMCWKMSNQEMRTEHIIKVQIILANSSLQMKGVRNLASQ